MSFTTSLSFFKFIQKGWVGEDPCKMLNTCDLIFFLMQCKPIP